MTTAPLSDEATAARTHVPPRAERPVSWALVCIAVDVVMLSAAIVTANLGAPSAGVSRTPAIWSALFAVGVMLLIRLRGGYRERLRLQILDDIRTTVAATAIAAVTVISLRVLVSDDPSVAAQTIREWAFATLYLGAGRAGVFWGQRRARRAGQAGRATLIVGAGRVGQLVARRLREYPELGLHPIGFLDKEPLATVESGVPVLGASWDLESVVREYGIEHVVITFSTAPHHVLLDLVRRCEAIGLGVSHVPRLFENVTDRVTIEHIGGLPLLSVSRADPKGWQFGVKYVLDRLVAALLCVVVLPIMLPAAVAVLASMGRPVFYRQARVGRDGRVFDMLKFRTMRGTPEHHGEADIEWARHQLGEVDAGALASRDDDRRTAVGRFLRRFSIDELPQLLNVLRGDMSLVGPRPERVSYVQEFEQGVHGYRDRHRVKSGITGWAQVHGLRGKTSLADRVEWDNYYIENWSLWLDLKILLLTVVAVFRHHEPA
jgi:exopolysaccharide biosynthesis polyprenyl glycosylphosphotransferase